MSVTYKRMFRKNPTKTDGSGLYHPQLIIWGKSATLDTLAVQMKENSSLSLGDIRSVLINFVSAMRTELYNGHSVNIDGFGVFSLSASTVGTEKKKDCQADKIKAVRINFRASSAIRPSLDTTTRAENRIDFVDLETQLARLNMTPSEDGGEEGGGSGGGGSDGDQGENPLG